MLLVPPFHVIIIADSSFFVKDQLANFELFFLENIMNTKICSKCLIEKSYSEYYKNKIFCRLSYFFKVSRLLKNKVANYD